MSNQSDDECCKLFLKIVAYIMAAGGILKIASASITMVLAIDVDINNNYNAIDLKNLGTPYDYIWLLLGLIMIYYLFVLFCGAIGVWKTQSGIALIASMSLWVSFITANFANMLINNTDMRCGGCDYNTLKNDHLHNIYNISMCISCVSILIISIVSFIEYRISDKSQVSMSNKLCVLCNVIWYILFPLCIWFIFLSMLCPETTQSISNNVNINTESNEVICPEDIISNNQLNNVGIQSPSSVTFNKYNQML